MNLKNYTSSVPAATTIGGGGGVNKPCKCCQGSGVERDDLIVGRDMRALRTMTGISLSSMAAHLGISKGYLSQLEHGKRSWTTELIAGVRRKSIKLKPAP